MSDSDAHDLFLRALDLPAKHRPDFLAAECSSDELRAEVEDLLAALDEADGFLDESAASAQAVEQAGTLVAGRYRLLEEIGEGGFGVVWMADQVEPVRRRVALKILKAGMDTRSVVARFMAERQALALMDHPNIARVHDAGTTDSGRPFFVMELVQGLPITGFCDEAGLDIPARLRLFVQVCHAVEHAHQKGIVHRDLKPGNLLVGLVDQRPIPRVIDFGVAKAIRADELTQLTLFTGFRQAVGTPEYMAPEQTGLSMVDVDTRADVYALGVVLYELLTGKKPFSLKDTVSDGVGYDEFLRRIREVDPPKPSTRVAHSGDELAEVAERRGLGIARLGRTLRGDLDWIVIKALQKERDRRYPTASALAAEVERYLDGRPVEAGPPSYWYRLQRFAGQHRVALSVVGVVFAALLGAVISTTLALDRALAAESHSRMDAQRTRAALSAMRRFIGDVNPHSPIGPGRTLRELLDQRGGALIAATVGQPSVEASVRATIGSAYRAMGVLDVAREHLERAIELHRDPAVRDDRGRADSLWHMASLLHDEGRFEDALELLAESLALLEAMPEDNEVEQARRWYLRADMLRHLGRHGEAVEAVEPAIEVFSREPNEHLSLALSLNVPGMVAMDRRKPHEAEPLFRRSLARARHAEPGGGLVTCTCLVNLATALLVRGRNEEAEEYSREALELYRKLLPGNHPKLISAINGLAIALERQGDYAGASPLIEESLTLAREYGMRDTLSFVRMATRLGNHRQRSFQHDAAAELYEEALGVLRKLLRGNGDNSESAMLASYSARALLQAGRPAEALPYVRSSLAWREENRPDDWMIWEARSILGGCLGAVGRDEEAERLMVESLEELDPPEHQWTRRVEAVDRLIVFHRNRSEEDPHHAEREISLRKQREEMIAEHSAPAEDEDR